MNTTKVTQSVRRNHVAATIERDGVRVGHVIARGTKFSAVRKAGTPTDWRLSAAHFKTIAAAVKWVEATI